MIFGDIPGLTLFSFLRRRGMEELYHNETA